MSKEAKARIKINKLLEEAGWRFFDSKERRANIVLENKTKLTQTELDEFGEDFEKTKNGFIDYLLLDDKGFPFIVLEAKKVFVIKIHEMLINEYGETHGIRDINGLESAIAGPFASFDRIELFQPFSRKQPR